MANAAEALRTIEQVGRENLGVNFDTANILYYNEGCGQRTPGGNWMPLQNASSTCI